MHTERHGRRWRLRKPSWALIMWIVWSALWLAWLIVEGMPLGPVTIAFFVGFWVVIPAFLLRTRYQGKMKDWERRKADARELEALEAEARELEVLSREAAEFVREEDHDPGGAEE